MFLGGCKREQIPCSARNDNVGWAVSIFCEPQWFIQKSRRVTESSFLSAKSGLPKLRKFFTSCSE